MRSDRMEIALYGKGGIGKSTICSHLSAALAKRGERVLQIGCDPKHDSTRLLLQGRELTTVLEYLKRVSPGEARPEEILAEGYLGIGCIEAGGPRPGVGCAGRGIISAFEFLERNRVKDRYDRIMYDVLGDVVCGGFAVPIRREYADAVFLVTSGEFMALYAANNILRGIRNYDGSTHRRVAGIIFNRRNTAGEEERVERFAAAVRLPVCASVPRSNVFALAEQRNCTVQALKGTERRTEEAETVCRIFDSLAARIGGFLTLYEALPLEDGELEETVLGNARPMAVPAGEAAEGSSEAALKKAGEKTAIEPEAKEGRTPARRAPLYGCAFTGAATTAVLALDQA